MSVNIFALSPFSPVGPAMGRLECVEVHAIRLRVTGRGYEHHECRTLPPKCPTAGKGNATWLPHLHHIRDNASEDLVDVQYSVNYRGDRWSIAET